jgi:hypothetical protein
MISLLYVGILRTRRTQRISFETNHQDKLGFVLFELIILDHACTVQQASHNLLASLFGVCSRQLVEHCAQHAGAAQERLHF